jgi:hypothetical protein
MKTFKGGAYYASLGTSERINSLHNVYTNCWDPCRKCCFNGWLVGSLFNNTF